jgi:hypothetical protein
MRKDNKLFSRIRVMMVIMFTDGPSFNTSTNANTALRLADYYRTVGYLKKKTQKEFYVADEHESCRTRLENLVS